MQDALMEAIQKNRWTLADLARESGLSMGHLSRLISGDRAHSPTLNTLEAIARVCGKDIKELL